MAELSYIAKIKQALELAKKAKTGCSLTLFDVIELLGHIEMLEETIESTKMAITEGSNRAADIIYYDMVNANAITPSEGVRNGLAKIIKNEINFQRQKRIVE